MSDDELTRLESGRLPGHLTYYPQTYGDGRFRVIEPLATAGQGYALLVEDTWCGGAAVLKGMWWKQVDIDDLHRARQPLDDNNHLLLNGLHAAQQATQLSQQAPTVIAVLRQQSPVARMRDWPGDLPECFVVQQLVGDGGQAAPTLLDLLDHRSARLSSLELLDLADQLCNGLAAVHAPRPDGTGRRSKWIHSDLKPENVLVLGPPYRYVLIDYDGAVRVGDPIPTSTPGYSPPERRGGPNRELDKADEKFDIYLLGATLAHAAGLTILSDETRLLLYGSEDDHVRGKQRIEELGYGPIVTTIIASCLAEPDKRIGTVGAVQTDLGRARDNALLTALLNA